MKQISILALVKTPAGSPPQVHILCIPPQEGELEKWEPVVGQPLHPAIEAQVNEDTDCSYEKILVILDGMHETIVEELRSEDYKWRERDRLDSLEDLLSKCLQGALT